MIASSSIVNVQHSYFYLEEMVCELVCDELVPPGELLAGEAEQDAVHRAEVVQVARVVHLLVQLHVEGDLEPLLSLMLSYCQDTVSCCHI